MFDFASLEDVLAEVLLAGWSKDVLKFIEEEVQELLCIALDCRVGWVSFEVFVGEAEFGRVDVAAA